MAGRKDNYVDESVGEALGRGEEINRDLLRRYSYGLMLETTRRFTGSSSVDGSFLDAQAYNRRLARDRS